MMVLLIHWKCFGKWNHAHNLAKWVEHQGCTRFDNDPLDKYGARQALIYLKLGCKLIRAKPSSLAWDCHVLSSHRAFLAGRALRILPTPHDPTPACMGQLSQACMHRLRPAPSQLRSVARSACSHGGSALSASSLGTEAAQLCRCHPWELRQRAERPWWAQPWEQR